MTYPLYIKDGKYYRTFTELPDREYDELYFIELPMNLMDQHPLNASLDELIKLHESHTMSYVGMHGLTEHEDWLPRRYS